MLRSLAPATQNAKANDVFRTSRPATKDGMFMNAYAQVDYTCNESRVRHSPWRDDVFRTSRLITCNERRHISYAQDECTCNESRVKAVPWKGRRIFVRPGKLPATKEGIFRMPGSIAPAARAALRPFPLKGWRISYVQVNYLQRRKTCFVCPGQSHPQREPC